MGSTNKQVQFKLMNRGVHTGDVWGLTTPIISVKSMVTRRSQRGLCSPPTLERRKKCKSPGRIPPYAPDNELNTYHK